MKPVTYTTAFLADQVGFRQGSDYSHMLFDEDTEVEIFHETGVSTRVFFIGETLLQKEYYTNGSHRQHKFFVEAPYQSQLADWLRKEHEIDIFLVPIIHGEEKHYVCGVMTRFDLIGSESSFSSKIKPINKTYEEAMEACLLEGLKEVQNRLKTASLNIKLEIKGVNVRLKEYVVSAGRINKEIRIIQNVQPSNVYFVIDEENTSKESVEQFCDLIKNQTGLIHLATVSVNEVPRYLFYGIRLKDLNSFEFSLHEQIL